MTSALLTVAHVRAEHLRNADASFGVLVDRLVDLVVLEDGADDAGRGAHCRVQHVDELHLRKVVIGCLNYRFARDRQ